MGTAKQMCVMYIDDEPLLGAIVVELLLSLGFSVDSYASAVQAWQQAKSVLDNYDLIISDHIMQDMSGLEFAARVREVGYQGAFIILSGRDLQYVDPRPSVQYIDCWLTKPIVTAELVKQINAVLHKK